MVVSMTFTLSDWAYCALCMNWDRCYVCDHCEETVCGYCLSDAVE